MSAVPDRSEFILQRMVDAVDQVQQRLLHAVGALRAGGVDYAVAGGNAVAAWVATVDEAAVRNTPRVDILIRRFDIHAARAAMGRAGFVYRGAAGVDLFLDDPASSPRSAVRIGVADEDGDPGILDGAVEIGELRVLSLDGLVRRSLRVFRLEDRLHLRDLMDVGLVDQAWCERLTAPLAERLRSLLDTPEG